MRTLIFILTLLIGFQPGSWAMEGHTSSMTDDKLQKCSKVHTPGLAVAQQVSYTSPSLQSYRSETKHHGSLYMAGSMGNSTVADCHTNCPGCCVWSAFLALAPVSFYPGITSFKLYQPLALYSFVSLTGSPEVHPPRARIEFV